MRLLDDVVVKTDGRGVFGTPPTVCNFIDRDFRDAETGQTLGIPDPLTGNTSFFVTYSRQADCLRAITNADQFYMGTNRFWSLSDRAKVFQTAGVLLGTKYRQKLAALIRLCMPKSAEEAEGELGIIEQFLMSMSFERLRRLNAPQDAGVGRGIYAHTETRVAPWGVVSMLLPFNYPLEIEALQIVAALACGNVVISHPHEYCGLASQAFLELLLEAGLPPQVIQLVHGYGPELSELAMNPLVQKILLTGSSKTAHELYSPRLVAEDSGINWLVVPEEYDTPVTDLAAQIAHSAYSLGGQRCSTTRILGVHSSWMRAGLAEEMWKWTCNNLKFEDYSLTTLMSWSTQRATTVMGRMEQAGMKRLWGGEPVDGFNYNRPKHSPANRFDYGAVHPVMFQIDPEQLHEELVATLMREERFFGNIVVIPFNDQAQWRQITGFLRTVPKRLTCAVATDRLEVAERIFTEIPPNGVCYWGSKPRTTGAPEFIPFGPCSVNGATIGGADSHIRAMWAAPYAFTHLVV